MLGQEVLSAFELTDHKLNYIAKVYPKEKNLAALNFENLIDNLANYIPANFKKKTGNDTIIELSESEEEETDAEDDDAEAEDNDDASDLNAIEVSNAFKRKKRVKAYNKKNATLIELIKDSSCEYNTKLYEYLANNKLRRFIPIKEKNNY